MIRKLNKFAILTAIFLIQSFTVSLAAAPYNPTPSDNLRNTAGGTGVLLLNTSSDNTGFGYRGLMVNNTGSYNSAFGSYSLQANTTGIRNTGIGSITLYYNTTGAYNTALGAASLYKNQTGSGNTSIGYQSLTNLSQGSFNTALGNNAGVSLSSGSYNIYMGNSGVSVESSTIRIGNTAQTRAFISGIRGRKTGVANAVPVMIDSNGQLGTINSAERFKENIQNMANASHSLLKLRPVTYQYKEQDANGEKPMEYGLIAEEVAKVYPDLVAYGADGKIETVQYHKLTPMLLNEYQMQNALLEAEKTKNKAQELTIQQQSQDIAALKQKMQELQNLQQEIALLKTQAQEIRALRAHLSKFEAQQTLGMAEGN